MNISNKIETLSYGNIVIVQLLVLSSCAIGSQWPHNNFIETYSYQLGKRIDDPTLYIRKKINSHILSNGNSEMELLHNMGKRGNCRVFYEYSSESLIIVDWRYVGNDKACAISP